MTGGDETFFDDQILLVLMDLPSGYLIMEEEADDRSYIRNFAFAIHSHLFDV